MASASRFDEPLARATADLAPDPELRGRVGRELRAHLADAADEYRAAGLPAAEAETAALRDLGDEAVLAAALADAHGPRLRTLRRWRAFLRLVPLPVALVLGGLLLAHGREGLAWLDLAERPAPAASPASPTLAGPLSTPAAKAADASQKAALLPDPPDPWEGFDVLAPRPAPPTAWLEALDRGEAFEPDNAYYNVMKAASWAVASTASHEDPRRISESLAEDGQVLSAAVRVASVRDETGFARVFNELRRAWAKPTYRNPAAQAAGREGSAGPETGRLAERLYRAVAAARPISAEAAWVARLRDALLAVALGEADQGRAEPAYAALDAADRLAVLLGAAAAPEDSATLRLALQTRVAALAYAKLVAVALGVPSRWAAADARLTEEGATLSRAAGLLHAMPASPPAGPGGVGTRPWAAARWAMAEEVGLGGIALALGAISAGMSAAAGLLVKARRPVSPAPPRIVPRPAEAGIALVVGVATPLALYAAWATAIGEASASCGFRSPAFSLAAHLALLGVMAAALAGVCRRALRRCDPRPAYLPAASPVFMLAAAATAVVAAAALLPLERRLLHAASPPRVVSTPAAISAPELQEVRARFRAERTAWAQA